MARQFYQLKHIWEVQLKDHRDYWNVRAAYDFWCENGTKTIHGRDFGWSQQWALDAMGEVKYDVHKLEEFAQFIRASRAEIRERYLYSISIPIAPNEEDSSTVHMSDIAESDIEPSPTHRPARRRFQNQEVRQSTASDVGSHRHPIIIAQDSDDEKERRRTDVRGPATPIRRINYGHVSFASVLVCVQILTLMATATHTWIRHSGLNGVQLERASLSHTFHEYQS